MATKLDLHLLEGRYAVCQLMAAASVPAWATGQGFVSISRSDEELTVVCHQSRVPPEVKAERDWRCLRLAGPFDFALTGILASVLYPLAEAGVGIFAVSTFNTDYVLLKHHQLKRAVAALEQAGHVVHV
ncbi:ACT domain-containing protein [Meiothermus sp.]|uniref:ACT domain-containing protein n=1 Tax=Meiothermus sp. TaxID=1955249 RepID=UPI0021DE2ACA|nr:ACT domain-containing protein [Meiothermus sp.]GIW34385.1 MAG: ACT domain-containing protein [Meiothermus sp.]